MYLKRNYERKIIRIATPIGNTYTYIFNVITFSWSLEPNFI